MRKYLAAWGIALLCGCTTGENATNLREGMTFVEVESILGHPDGFQRSGSEVGYQYTNRLISGWSWDRADYYTIFRDDRLVQWGPGEVRQGQGPSVDTLLVVPAR